MEGTVVAWSTRELAALAGTTVRAVRHYHEIGLLEEPRRHANGYKQYGVAHLVRTLRIKRLADLGFSLPQIADLGDADQHPREALRSLDIQLAQTLERLQRVRVEVHQILHQAAPTDLPAALAAKINDAGLSDADRSLLVVMSRVLEPAVVAGFVDTLQALPPSAAAAAFDDLPADADEPTRQDLAIRLLPRSRRMRAMLPGLWSATTGPGAAATRTVDLAVRDLYNPAQFDVLRRIGLLLRSQPDPDPVRLDPPAGGTPRHLPDASDDRDNLGPHRPPRVIVSRGLRPASTSPTKVACITRTRA
jgi:DNA-binding transcriptional MerR regulator